MITKNNQAGKRNLPGKRSLYHYFGVNTRSGHANLRYSYREAAGKEPPRRPTTVLHRIQDFLNNNFLAWFIHNWRVRKHYDYPVGIADEAIYPIAGETDTDITIGIAADWASCTPQSAYVGEKMDEKKFQYTIHLGDTYYSGQDKELADNFGAGINDFGYWPRGTKGSFALAGNHEMFSSGQAWLDMVRAPYRGFGLRIPGTGSFAGQTAPFFCLLMESWCVLGLDTGYQSLTRAFLRFNPDNAALNFPDEMMNWLIKYVKPKIQNKGILVLTHHQYISAFKNETEYVNPARQLSQLTDKEILWIWGHEHRFSMYGQYCKGDGYVAAYGRCIGNGGMPDEHTDGRKVDPDKIKSRNLVLYDYCVADKIVFDNGQDGNPVRSEDFGSNGYAALTINKENLAIEYYSCYGNGEDHALDKDVVVLRENWRYDPGTAKIVFIHAEDLSMQTTQKMSYPSGFQDPGGIGKSNMT